MSKHPGFYPKLEEQDQEDSDINFLGGKELNGKLLNLSRDWRSYRPKLEVQKNRNLDTYSCTNFANNNVTEEMHKLLYKDDVNYSDMFSARVSGTVYRRGNSHKNVAESRRKYGSVLESVEPFTEDTTRQQYYKKPPKEHLQIGLRWLNDYEYGYSRVNPKAFEDAIQFSPLQVAVDSSTNRTNHFKQADHSVVLDCIDNKNKKKYVFDSYLGRYDEYDWDYPFSFAYRFHYERITKVVLDEYYMKLIRDESSGRIYFLDSDGRKHHVEAPTDFTEYFGQKAWQKRNWFNLSADVVKEIPDGVSLSAKKTGLYNTLHNLFNNFGTKLK